MTNLLAEHLHLASLGGRLHAGLQPGHTWDDELASRTSPSCQPWWQASRGSATWSHLG